MYELCTEVWIAERPFDRVRGGDRVRLECPARAWRPVSLRKDANEIRDNRDVQPAEEPARADE